MTNFELSNSNDISISDSHSQRVTLNTQEALDLLHWLSDRKEALSRLAKQDVDRASREKQLEILLHEEDLGHLDELKATIPDLHESRPVVKVLNARWDKVTERALQLLKEYQLEYTVHPLLLDDHEAYAQG